MERSTLKNNVPALTALLSIISLALVFGAVLQAIPQSVIPRFDPLLALIPHLNVVLSLAAIGTILAGWRAIRQNRVGTHKKFMLASFALFAGFLVFYLYRVALLGPGEFPGPETVYLYIYLPTLAIHILLAVICVPFVFYALLLAGTRPVAEIYDTRHKTVGKIAAVLWLISFSLGIVVYLFLYVLY